MHKEVRKHDIFTTNVMFSYTFNNPWFILNLTSSKGEQVNGE